MDYNNRPGIDLHIHSIASDGSLTPAEILYQAKKLNLAAIAITDHDSLKGSKEALRIGIPSSLKFLTGVEISAAYPSFSPGSGSLHILGYAIRLDDPILNQTLDKLQQARKNRNPEIIKRLDKLGIRLSLDEVRKEAGQGLLEAEQGQLSRPHIAQAMVKKGFVQSIDEAFDKFLGTGKPAYVDKYRIGCADAIEMIRNAGGIPILAHPSLVRVENELHFEDLIVNLMAIGMKGIEVYYSEHSSQQINHYIQIAKKYDLLMTGGTDFHGAVTPEIKMGSGKGNLFIPYELYKKLVRI